MDFDLLRSLAPTHLRIEREDRYDGGGFSIALADLAAADAAQIRRIYDALQTISTAWDEMRDAPDSDRMVAQMAIFDDKLFLEAIQNVGIATYEENGSTPALRKALHDVRGGGLTSLIGYAQLLPRLAARGQLTPDRLKQIAFLARDHAKMMRNIFTDLDVARRQADEAEKLHHIDEFTRKWDNFVYESGARRVSVAATSDFDGYITNRCLETSAVDRILYNLVNNAVRFAADTAVSLTIFPVSDTLTRWVVANKVSARQKAWLANNVGDDFSQLFRGGLTRGGHGVGLSSATDFVASSFGLEADAALARRYIGAALHDHTYYAWFHWPVYMPRRADEPICDCHE